MKEDGFNKEAKDIFIKKEFENSDFILTRTNMSVDLAYKLLKDNFDVKIIGKEFKVVGMTDGNVIYSKINGDFASFDEVIERIIIKNEIVSDFILKDTFDINKSIWKKKLERLPCKGKNFKTSYFPLKDFSSFINDVFPIYWNYTFHKENDRLIGKPYISKDIYMLLMGMPDKEKILKIIEEGSVDDLKKTQEFLNNLEAKIYVAIKQLEIEEKVDKEKTKSLPETMYPYMIDGKRCEELYKSFRLNLCQLCIEDRDNNCSIKES
jgi:hypothetical protein